MVSEVKNKKTKPKANNKMQPTMQKESRVIINLTLISKEHNELKYKKKTKRKSYKYINVHKEWKINYESNIKKWPCYQAVKLEAQYPSNLLCCFEVKFASAPEMEQMEEQTRTLEKLRKALQSTRSVLRLKKSNGLMGVGYI